MVSLCPVFASAVNRQGNSNISRKCRPTRTGRLDFFFLDSSRWEGFSPSHSYIFSNTGKSVAGADDTRQPTQAVIRPAASRT